MNVEVLPPQPQKKTSPWVWVGLGCGAIVVMCVLLVVVAGFFLHGKLKNFQKQFDDPVVRNQRVREVLGAQDLPAGYHAFMTVSIPWVLDVAMLSDREFVKEHNKEHDKEHKDDRDHNPFDKRGFVYVRMPFHKKDARWQEFLDGKRSPDELLKNGKMHFHKRDTVGKGVIQGTDGATYHYVATRGEVEMGDRYIDGITTMIAVECPNDSKFRLGIWFGPDPTAKPGEGRSSGSWGSSTSSEGHSGKSGADEDANEDREDANEDREDAAEDREAQPPQPLPGGAEMGKPAASFAGSPADESAIKEFMSHFALCK